MRSTKLEFPADPLVLKSREGGITVSIPIRIKRYSGRREIVVPQGVSAELADRRKPTTLQAALARGHRWLRQIESGQVRNMTELAQREKVCRAYMSRMINLTTLAPDIQAAILDETLPEDKICVFELATNVPSCWEAQRRRVQEAV